MSLFETCVKLAAYLVCIGLALEVSHRAYRRAITWAVSQDLSTPTRCVLNSLAAAIPFASAIAVTALFTTLIHRKSLAILGLTPDPNAGIDVVRGAAIALGCVLVVFLFGVLMGFIQVRRSPLSDDCISCLPLFLGGLVDFFTGAVFEEIIFRGYVFFLLNQYWGPSTAVVASAAVFSLAHLFKHPETPPIFTLNAFIFGLLAGTSKLYTGSLWLPIGLHFGWNVVSGPILGLPYAGRTYDRGVVVSEVSGPSWLTGGLYSLDAGFLGTVALAVAATGLMATAPLP
jgi:membrane protease YdiL (CAAX protease family)